MRLLEWVKRRFRRLEAYAEHFQNTALSVGGVFPVRPVLCQTASRGLQVVQFAILAVAVGVDLTLVQAFFLQGIHLVSLALGAFVPAQAGVTEGTFILSASQVGITRLQAMTIALTTHAIQAVLIVCGILVPFVWKVRRPEKNTPETSWNRLSVSGRR